MAGYTYFCNILANPYLIVAKRSRIAVLAALGKLVEEVEQRPEEGLVGEQRPGAIRRAAQQSLVQLQLLIPHRVLVFRRYLLTKKSHGKTSGPIGNQKYLDLRNGMSDTKMPSYGYTNEKWWDLTLHDFH